MLNPHNLSEYQMSVESLSVCLINLIFMGKATKESVSLWPFVWILLTAFAASSLALILALFITN